MLKVVRAEPSGLLQSGEWAIDPISERLPAESRNEFYNDLNQAYASKHPKRMVRIVLDAWATTLKDLESAATARAMADSVRAESA